MPRHVAGADPRSFDRLAEDYDRFVSLEGPGLPEWVPPELPRSRRRALDAGCGSGRHSLALASHFDEVVGVDLSAAQIDIARRRRSHSRVRYVVRDLLSVEDPAGFDLVFSSTTLHHVADLTTALEHLRGLVAPEGAATLIDCVSRWRPPRWVYQAGAVREFPGNLARYGSREARWLYGFQTSRPWLDHLTSETYLSRRAFEARYGAVFPGARFRSDGPTHATIWHDAPSD